MARTRNTGRNKKTGGLAPRRGEHVDENSDTDNAPGGDLPPIGQGPISLDDEPIDTESDNACALCRNGEALVKCDSCVRCICTKICLPDALRFLTMKQIGKANIIFECPACHWSSPYTRYLPYYALYTFLDKLPRRSSLIHHPKKGLHPPESNLVAIAPNGLKLEPVAAIALHTREDTLATLVWHFFCDGMPDEGSGAAIAYHHLLASFSHLPKESGKQFMVGHELRYVPVPFGISSDPATEEENAANINTILQDIANSGIEYHRALVIVTTHSHSNNGDLFCNHNLTVPVRDFFRLVFTEPFLEYLADLESHFFFLSCGATVVKRESMEQVQQCVVRYNIDNAFLFGAKNLMRDTVSNFLLSYVQSVFINRFSFDTSVANLLEASHLLKGSSDVHYFGRSETCKFFTQEQIKRDPLRYTSTARVQARFTFCSNEKPCGRILSLTCPRCGVLRTQELRDPRNDNVNMFTATVYCSRKECNYSEQLSFFGERDRLGHAMLLRSTLRSGRAAEGWVQQVQLIDEAAILQDLQD